MPTTVPFTLLRPAAPPPGSAVPFAAAAAAMVAREAAISTALAAHSAARAASRHLPIAERVIVRRASSATYEAAVDKAHTAYRQAIRGADMGTLHDAHVLAHADATYRCRPILARAAVAPPAPPADVEPARSAGEVRFQHQFTVRLPHHPEPVKACADLRCHLGVPVVDRVTIFPRGTMFVTLEPRSDAFRRALREIRGPEAGAIRKRAFELMTADAELVEVVPTRFPSEQTGQALADLSAAINRAEVRA